MYYEVILLTGTSITFSTEAEADAFCDEHPDEWDRVMVRGEF